MVDKILYDPDAEGADQETGATEAEKMRGGCSGLFTNSAYEEWLAEKEKATPEKAKEIMGKDFLGPDEIEETFGFRLSPEQIPEIQFPLKRLKWAKEYHNQILVLHADRTPDGRPLTVEALNEIHNDGDFGLLRPLLVKEKHLGRNIFSKDVPRLGWRLLSKKTLAESEDKDELSQVEQVIAKLKGMFMFLEMPEAYKEAIAEFEAERPSIVDLFENKRESHETHRRIRELKINGLTRPKVAELIQAIAIYKKINGEDLLLHDFVQIPHSESSPPIVISHLNPPEVVPISETDGYWRKEWSPVLSLGA